MTTRLGGLLFVSVMILSCLPAARGQIWLANSNVWVTGQERMRLEYRENNVTFNDTINKDTDSWLLQRARLGIGAKGFDWVKIFGELQDAREMGSTRFAASPPGNADLEEDTIDWRQGWIEIANYKQFPLGAKVGRQELSYGDERLIGTFDWNNAGRVFDAAKVRLQEEKFWVDLFKANVVLNNVQSSRDQSFDDSTYWGDDLIGLYAQTTLLSFQITEGYVLYRDKDSAEFDGPARRIWTLGTRWKSTPKLAPWDYYLEVASQVGEVDKPGSTGTGKNPARRFGDNSLKNGIDHHALAAVIGGGFTCTNCPTKPRVGLEYNYASGDSNPNDKESTTFDNLFPTNHKFYGYMDLFAWKNIHNTRLTLSASPHKTVVAQVDYHPAILIMASCTRLFGVWCTDFSRNSA